MKKKMPAIALSAVSLLTVMCVLGGCASGGAQSSPGDVAYPPAAGDEETGTAPFAPTAAPAPSTAKPGEISYEADGAVDDVSVDRMVVRNGFLELVVDDVDATAQTVSGMAATFGGHVVSSSVYQDGGRTYGSVVIRVDANRFDSALGAIRALAVEVARETTSSTDVTEEYVDLSARKHNLERTEEQLLALMEQAGTVEDLLKVQQEVSRVRGEIEQIEGRMKYLEQTSATSLIEIFLRESVLTVTFSADVRVVDEGEPVAFTADVSGGFVPYSYAWDFGDGETSNQATPAHSYRDEGWYGVRLTVTDDRGASATEYRDTYVRVNGVWSPSDVFHNAVGGLGSVGRGLVSLLIWFLVYAPVWLVLGGIAYLIYRRATRKLRVEPNDKREV